MKIEFEGSINLFFWFLSQFFAITSFTLLVLVISKRFQDQNNWYLVIMKAQPSGLACNKNDWKWRGIFLKVENIDSPSKSSAYLVVVFFLNTFHINETILVIFWNVFPPFFGILTDFHTCSEKNNLISKIFTFPP